MHIELLTRNNLEPTKRLFARIFSPLDAQTGLHHLDAYAARNEGGDPDGGSNRLRGFWVAENGGAIVGFIGLYSLVGMPHEAWLGWFGVSEEARGLGVGRELLSVAEGEALRQKVETLRVWTTTEPDMADGSAFYRRMGFRFEEDCGPYVSLPPYRVIVFSKPLAGGSPPLWLSIPDRPAEIGGVELVQESSVPAVQELPRSTG